MLRRSMVGMTALTIIPPDCAEIEIYAKHPYEIRPVRD